jgi:formate dehydrogenase major subunit
MKLSRRRFLQLGGTVTAGLAVGSGDIQGTVAPRAVLPDWDLRTSDTLPVYSICPFCAVGCGLICHREAGTGRVVYTEGDPDHPINGGALCAKGAAVDQLARNERRLKKVLYRAPRSDRWEEKDWKWVIPRMAERIRQTRDSGFERVDRYGWTVNRCNTIASVGSAALDNEECWTYQAMLRALGLVYIEHQARI